MDEWIKNLPKGVLTVAGSVAVLASGAAGWMYFGFPVPMTVQMHSQYHGHEAAVESAEAALSFAQKAVDNATEGTQDHIEATAHRDAMQARLDALRVS